MTGDPVGADKDFCVGVGLGSFAVGDGRGDASGVGVGFEAESAADVLDPVLVFELELVRAEPLVVAEFDRSAVFLFVAGDGVFRLFAFEFLFDSIAELEPDSRPRFDATSEGRAPGTVMTTSSLFVRCST